MSDNSQKTWYKKNAWWIWTLIVVGIILIIGAIVASVVAIVLALLGGIGGGDGTTSSEPTSSPPPTTSSDFPTTSSSEPVTSSSEPTPPVLLMATPCYSDYTTVYIRIDQDDDYFLTANPALLGTGSISFNLCNDPGDLRKPLNLYFKENISEKDILFGTDSNAPSGYNTAATPLGYVFDVPDASGLSFDAFYKLTGTWVHSQSFQNITFDLLTNDNTDPQTYGIQTFNTVQQLGYTQP